MRLGRNWVASATSPRKPDPFITAPQPMTEALMLPPSEPTRSLNAPVSTTKSGPSSTIFKGSFGAKHCLVDLLTNTSKNSRLQPAKRRNFSSDLSSISRLFSLCSSSWLGTTARSSADHLPSSFAASSSSSSSAASSSSATFPKFAKLEVQLLLAFLLGSASGCSSSSSTTASGCSVSSPTTTLTIAATSSSRPVVSSSVSSTCCSSSIFWSGSAAMPPDYLGMDTFVMSVATKRVQLSRPGPQPSQEKMGALLK
mmetsp:Transcript_17611/g.28187  ORF Transcript_17611/g.28187 Transcript_17611/m.28187 type:complete len:255 (+) Transcript_17611:80-844(+)